MNRHRLGAENDLEIVAVVGLKRKTNFILKMKRI
jgi:hypothetical protein